ncbi:MAG: UDP-N-acetylmuramate dehydrogenase [Bacteroides sp.]|nr:UDP-N-acetylmuramate dehydrogenase [Bacteroides sp.]
MTIEENKSIPNTFGLDVKAKLWLEYESSKELREIITTQKIIFPYLHVGACSNMLFLGDYDGTVLHSGIWYIETAGMNGNTALVRAGAGTSWDALVTYCVKNNYYGAENLSHIPGEVGSAVVQNIGAYGVEVKDLKPYVETMDIYGNTRTYSWEECEFGYRQSIFKRPEMKNVFITSVTFHLSRHEQYKLDYGAIREELKKYPKVNLRTVREVIIEIRDSKLPDPDKLGNAGSFFMNPVIPRVRYEILKLDFPDIPSYPVDEERVKVPAAWLIEQCGWKGRSWGPAAVHDKQPLVLVNRGGATGKDILALSDAIRMSVRERFGIDIRPEVNII